MLAPLLGSVAMIPRTALNAKFLRPPGGFALLEACGERLTPEFPPKRPIGDAVLERTGVASEFRTVRLHAFSH
jgi:hypothetical protein